MLANADAITYRPAGELKEYVVEEVNVRSLQTCSDPLQYCTLRAEPDYPSLGKRLGKAMAKIGKAVKGMTTQQILDFEAQGRITLEGESLGSGEIRVGQTLDLFERVSSQKCCCGCCCDAVFFTLLDHPACMHSQCL